MIKIPETLLPVGVLDPAADAAGRTGLYISKKNVQRLFLLAYITQGNAATVKLTPTQASAVAGTGAKALTGTCRIWANEDAAAQTFTRQTDAKDFTTSAALKDKIVIFEITGAELDVANGFDCVTIATGASHAANITSVIALVDGRYSVVPSVITD
jgi:hypothetical protein